MSVKGKNPKEVLREKTRNLPRQFPEGVCFNRSAAGGISAWLPFNGVHYEAFGDYSKHAVQKLAVYILYGEFGQDAVELYNYYLQSDAKSSGKNKVFFFQHKLYQNSIFFLLLVLEFVIEVSFFLL